MQKRVTGPKEAGLTRPVGWHPEDREGSLAQSQVLPGYPAGGRVSWNNSCGG